MRIPQNFFLSWAQDYCENTSLHGWAYLPSERWVMEKLFWAGVIFSGIVYGSKIVNETFA